MTKQMEKDILLELGINEDDSEEDEEEDEDEEHCEDKENEIEKLTKEVEEAVISSGVEKSNMDSEEPMTNDIQPNALDEQDEEDFGYEIPDPESSDQVPSLHELNRKFQPF